ncbi:MAG: helix-turn-helix transcriptional regulator, partial [Clostridia bacterium]|nr:helix-turn-helix transcriptional regulator [Clostridia bacterium]
YNISTKRAAGLNKIKRGVYMILADKIIGLRKKNGWSQDELADKMNVSRQAISKWERAQTTPDLEKILQLSVLFCVTTDYLLKDEIEDEEFTTDTSSDTIVKRISIEEANEYIEQRKKASWRLALATFLCIISPITIVVLSILAELPNPIVTEAIAGAVGITVLFGFVICAVSIYIYCGFKNQPYAFLDKNIPFELEYGVKGFVAEKKNNFGPTYVSYNIIATCVCIFAVAPLVLLSFTENEILVAVALALLMIIAGIGAGMFIVAGAQKASMQKLLKEGEFTDKEKKKTGIRESVGFCYWCILTAIFLTWSFLTNHWHISWLIFAIGGILFPMVMCICNLIADKQKKD